MNNKQMAGDLSSFLFFFFFQLITYSWLYCCIIIDGKAQTTVDMLRQRVTIIIFAKAKTFALVHGVHCYTSSIIIV